VGEKEEARKYERRKDLKKKLEKNKKK